MPRKAVVADQCRSYAPRAEHASTDDRFDAWHVPVQGVHVAQGGGGRRSVPRVIGTADGSRKLMAISGAVRGGWINILITDLATVRALLDEYVPN